MCRLRRNLFSAIFQSYQFTDWSNQLSFANTDRFLGANKLSCGAFASFRTKSEPMNSKRSTSSLTNIYTAGRKTWRKVLGSSHYACWSSDFLWVMDRSVAFSPHFSLLLSPTIRTNTCRNRPALRSSLFYSFAFVPNWFSIQHAWCSQLIQIFLTFGSLVLVFQQ